MLEQSSKPHSLTNRSNWKSSNALTTKSASRLCFDVGSSSEHFLATTQSTPIAPYEAFALIAEGYAKLATICIMLKRLAGTKLRRAT